MFHSLPTGVGFPLGLIRHPQTQKHIFEVWGVAEAVRQWFIPIGKQYKMAAGTTNAVYVEVSGPQPKNDYKV